MLGIIKMILAKLQTLPNLYLISAKHESYQRTVTTYYVQAFQQTCLIISKMNTMIVK